MIVHDEEEPKTMKHALSGPKAKEWFQAMKEEMNSMESNRVWDLVNLLPSHKTIGNKWILNIKHKVEPSILILLRPARSVSKSCHPLYANEVHVIHNFKIIQTISKLFCRTA